ncbi:MAG TPA: peptidylprolyl isomerase [Candidatus Limnocylindrales bacterium]|nr:peptidylprolyl isomerase [Candidatus Limnocylindrales bacterium]
MTLRARPVARRKGRAGWDSGDRRNSLINLGFFLAIGVSVLILVGYAAWSWYDDHYGAAATVDGTTINKDQLRNRIKIEQFGLDYIASRINTLMAQGKIDSATGQQQLQLISQRQDQIVGITLERLIDNQLQGKLAGDKGITVSDAEIDQELAKRATTDEERHVWMIEVEPAADAVTGEVTDEAKRTALGDAQRALARLKNGESWDDVAKTVSTSGNAPQAGDIGWVSKDSGYDEPFMNAVFSTDVNKPTDVITGDDGVYRIGRYTEVEAASVDGTFQDQIEGAGIALADYRTAVKGDVLRSKLSDQVVADLSAPGKQRHVLEIFLPTPNASQAGVTEGGVKVRQIVFAPNDSTVDTPPDTDPAWAKAKADAEAAYNELKLHPEKFDEMARAMSDERSGKLTGGKQPWYYPGSTVDPTFRQAILDPNLKPGDLIAPVKSTFAWHVIQFMRGTGDGDKAFLTTLKGTLSNEAAFRTAAINNSEGKEAKDGGDLGWIASGQESDTIDAAIFATAVGSVSDVVSVSDGTSEDGQYLFMVLAEEQRDATPEQIKIFKSNGFDTWYTRQKAAAKIDRFIVSQSTTG